MDFLVVCHEARTNDVAMVEPTTNAVVSQACLLHGASEAGEWMESATPFFRWGTNDIRRLYASPGSLSFGTKRHPYLGDSLPNGTPAESLVVLRTPLGIVPEANWPLLQTGNGQPETGNGGECRSRFWHDELPGGGRVFTWENALLDRLPDRPATIQAELRPNGDFVYRYDFSHAAPTNAFLVGAQQASAAVEALRVGNAETNSATVYRLDGNCATNGISIADLFATAPILELRWKNTSGLGNLSGDTDGDGLTDWDEVFLHGTDPEFADTDGDGTADNVELTMGTDPFDADENDDGVPDGTSAAAWAAHPLWATNSVDGGANLVVTLSEATIAPATLIVGNLAIPLASPSSWLLRLEPGQMVDFRLHTQGNNPVDISLSPPPAESMRTMAPRRDSPSSGGSAQSPLWQNPGNALNGPTGNTSGQMAIPKMEVYWVVPQDGSHDTDSLGPCLHNDAPFAVFHPVVLPNGTGLGVDDIQLQGAQRIGGNIGLPVDAEPGSTASAQVILPVDNFRWGYLECQLDAHRKDGGLGGSHCSICEMAGEHIDDVSLSVRSPLTLKHDNEAAIAFHCEKPDHGPASNPAIRIRRVGTTEWHTLAQSFSHLWTAKIAGFFELKGVATMDGDTFETAPVVVEVQYPDYAEIFTDDDVIAICTNVWGKMMSLCSETNRQEVGCWIVLDTRTEEYNREELKYGDSFGEDETASVFLPMKSINNIIALPPTALGFCYPVATVHAHTPTEHRSTGRPVGPSDADIQVARNYLAAPSAVIDYLPAFDPEKPNEPNRIPAHHPSGSPGKLWKIGFPERRPTPATSAP